MTTINDLDDFKALEPFLQRNGSERVGLVSCLTSPFPPVAEAVSDALAVAGGAAPHDLRARR